MPIANDFPEVLETSEPERLATGFIFTEGPLWHPDGHWYFVDLRREFCGAASARIGATLPQCQTARIVIRHPFNPAPHPQHHRRLALSNYLAHDQNPAAPVGTRIASSASVRAEKRAVDRRILVDDDRRRVGHVGATFSNLFSLGGLLIERCPLSPPSRFASRRGPPQRDRRAR